MELDDAFRTRLKWAIESREPSITQSDLAKHLGISAQAVSQWMSGLTRNPRRTMLSQAAEYLGVNLEYLAYGRGPMRRGEKTAPIAEDTIQPSSEALFLAREIEQSILAALPESAQSFWQSSISHPLAGAKLRVDWLKQGALLAVLGIYSKPQNLVAASRQKLWQLLVARETLPRDLERKTALILIPINLDQPTPTRHIEALQAEARLVGIDVLHASTPEQAAALLSGHAAIANPLPVEDELGLDSSTLL